MIFPDDDAVERQVRSELASVGLALPHVAQLDCSDTRVASLALPILASWIDRLRPGNPLRHSLYFHFGYRTMYPWFQDVVRWWREEMSVDNGVAQSELSRILAGHCRANDAPMLLELCRAHKSFPARSEVLLRLTKFSVVKEEAILLAVRELTDSVVDVGDLLIFAKIKDRRVQEAVQRSAQWELRPGVKAADRKGRGNVHKPVWIAGTEGPDLSAEVWSGGVSLELAGDYLVGFAKSRGLIISEYPLPEPTEGSGWFHSDIDLLAGRHRVWFRYEDVDAVEIVITRE